MLRESKLFQSIPVPSSNSRTPRRQRYWSCIARQCIVTETIYRVHLPLQEREWIEFHNQKWINSKEDKRFPSLQWIRCMMEIVWVKHHAIWRHQGSRHTRIRGNASKIRYFGAIWSSLKRKACNFTKHGHMQSFSTTHNLQLDKAVCMKTQDELYQKVRLTPRVPHVVLKPNSQYGQQDPQSQDATSSWEPSSDSKSYGETCNNTVDYRIPGVPLSAVEQLDTTRANKVKKLVEKFENRKDKESFIQDLSQTQKINKFSKESQDLIADLINTEIFELCENSSKQQCPNCNAYWEVVAVVEEIWNLRGGKQSSTRTTVTSPRYVSSRGAKHGPSERQRMFYHAKQMLKKARQQKHGRHRTILSRWYASESYRNSLSAIGWKEKHTMLYDRIALEKHIHVATRAERIQNSKHWIPTLNKEGPQQPLNQRSDFAHAKRLHDELLARTQEEYRTIPRSQQVRQRKGQQFEGNEEYDYAVDPETGWRFCKGSRANLQTASSSSSKWDQTHWKTSNGNSQHSSSPDDWWNFSQS